MSNSRLENQKAAVKQWFRDALNVESPKEMKAIIKEFCDYTGFEPPRSSRNKEIRQVRWDNWRFTHLVKRWDMFQLWISEEVRKAQAAEGKKSVKTPADLLMNNMITV